MIKIIKEKLINNGFSFFPTFKRLWQKGGLTLIRGVMFKAFFLRRFKGLLFLGKGCRIFNSSFLKLGNNVYIGDYSYLDFLSKKGVILEDNVTIREFAWCQLTSSLNNPGEYIHIKRNTYIGPRCILGAAAPLVIGENCQIGANVSFIAENHNFSGEGLISEKGVNRKGITIENGCWIGNNTLVLDGVTIGEGCVIGAGSVVTKNVPAYSVAVGVPCKVIKSRATV